MSSKYIVVRALVPVTFTLDAETQEIVIASVQIGSPEQVSSIGRVWEGESFTIDADVAEKAIERVRRDPLGKLKGLRLVGSSIWLDQF